METRSPQPYESPSAPHSPDPVTVGIDLGGTGTRIVTVDATGNVRQQINRPTQATQPPDEAVQQLLDSITAVADGFELTAVGIGASGPVDQAGIIQNPDTLPALTGRPIACIIADTLEVPCTIDNDAVTAAIGEHAHGAGRGSHHLLVVTLGTGIGVCYLHNGKPFRAADGSHPEAGHIAVSGGPAPCYCGLPACWEQVASRTALNGLTNGKTDELAARARQGDPVAFALFEKYGDRIGDGLATLLTIFRPDRVVLAGGATQFLDLFLPGIDKKLHRSSQYTCRPTIEPAQLGNFAGAVGAAVHARHECQKHPK